MIPEAFLARMKVLLGDEYPDFYRTLSEEKAEKAVRVNLKKTTVANFLQTAPFACTKLPYLQEGFSITEEKPGNTPEHHAGMFYVQDPSAMATLAALDIQEDWKVLDMCAAPGGKSTQIASFLSNKGTLIANEYVANRCKILASNIERLGIQNAIVCHADAGYFKENFQSVFDLVLVDAPCSGEGMLRKYAVEEEEWSEEAVLNCAKRQKGILENIAPTVKSHGYLLYSTCTFSLEENEKNVVWFLKTHPEFHLVPVKEELVKVTAPGISYDGCLDFPLSYTRRFYPHKTKGEGQFIALFQKEETGESPIYHYKDSIENLSKEENVVLNSFLKETFSDHTFYKIRKQGSNIVALPNDFPIPPKGVFYAGVPMGESKGKYFLPSHQLFMAYGIMAKRQWELTHNSQDIGRFYHGDEIQTSLQNGFCVVTYKGVPTGFGKVSDGKMKNHYPKGLRITDINSMK